MYVELRLCCLHVPASCLLSLRMGLLAWKPPTLRSLIKPRCGKHDAIPELVGFANFPSLLLPGPSRMSRCGTRFQVLARCCLAQTEDDTRFGGKAHVGT